MTTVLVGPSTSAATPGRHSKAGQATVQSVNRPRLPPTNSTENSPLSHCYVMRHTDRTPLPEWIQDAYDYLEPHFEETSDGLARRNAHELLLSGADRIEADGDATHAIDRLLDRGWLYEIDGTLYRTEQ